MNLVRNVKSRGLSVFSLINIINLPFLTELVCELRDSDVLTFTILLVNDLNDLAILNIFEVVLRVLEFLEPCSISFEDLQVVCVS
jgi:hypothetical protein